MGMIVIYINISNRKIVLTLFTINNNLEGANKHFNNYFLHSNVFSPYLKFVYLPIEETVGSWWNILTIVLKENTEFCVS